MNQRVKQMDQTLLLIPATMVAYRLGIHTWNIWYVAILVILATRVKAQEINLSQNSDGLPLREINTSQEEYQFKAFNCDEPEDVGIQNIPCRFPEEAQEMQLQGRDLDSGQEYTILQEVKKFEYPATLCSIRRSRDYYDYV